MTEATLLSTLLALPVLAAVGVAPVQAPCEGWLTGPFWEKADPGAVRACLSAGYSVDDRSAPNEATPLHWAARFSDDPDVIGTLVRAGARLEATTRARLTPLHWAARYNRNPTVAGALLEYGADAYAETRHGRTPLHLAALVNENPLVVDTLAGVTDVNVRKHNGGTPLHDAARRVRDGTMGNPNPAIVDVLIRRGADLSAETMGGLTPAGRARDERLAELLREEEALLEAVRAQFLQSVAMRCAVAVLILGLLGYLVARLRRMRPRVSGA
ncbi:MAG: ankyrin repeat domain-containing protein [Gemmatimonadota bacterium]|uniref:ankyrin repeat domain-containing protein n=1 Tax=Candidatus Palauibacter scopulicola TaxID=3056741 RepID=UPI002390D123|nr:ankyrin repeat domain-containing protein [Candidatus Palauibacter scopulicola]MDE2662494.1 ankyrin repeat domain-containing protein [Candidatus Palauibacter scopulicola]